MSRYAPLVSLTIEHEFFVGNRCDALSCEPGAASTRLARDCEMVLKSRTDGVTVYLDQDRADALTLAQADPAAPPELWFRLRPQDPALANFTFPSTPRDGAVLFFSNTDATPAVDGGPQSLSAEDTVSESDFVTFDDEVLATILTARDRRIPPFAFVRLVLGDLTPRRYELRFEARQTFWKYYLLGEMALPTATIVDTRQEVEFETGVETTLADDRRAISFTSKARIPLRQQSDCHFQLREVGSGVNRVLIRHLPVASPDRLYKDTINGREALVSDIYINC